MSKCGILADAIRSADARAMLGLKKSNARRRRRRRTGDGRTRGTGGEERAREREMTVGADATPGSASALFCC